MTELRELHRIIDARISQWADDRAPQFVRGVVTEVDAGQRLVSARLDLAVNATQAISYPAAITPVVGDDVIVMRRRDGFLLVAWVLGRD